jgi:hypothetical protein
MRLFVKSSVAAIPSVAFELHIVVGGISGGPTVPPLLLLPPLPLPEPPLPLPLAPLLPPLPLPPLLPPELPPLPPLLPPSTYTTVVVEPQATAAPRHAYVRMCATLDPLRFPFICAPSVSERKIPATRRD